MFWYSGISLLFLILRCIKRSRFRPPTRSRWVLSGVDDVTVEQDSEFEPLVGVSATDDVDGDVTDAVKVSGSVDAAKPGEYVLT